MVARGSAYIPGQSLAPREPFDHYPTPVEFVRAALTPLATRIISDNPCILDPGAGNGVWGTVARTLWPKAMIVGVEIRDVVQPDAYDFWLHGNWLKLRKVPYECPIDFDLIIGNPPYNMAEQFVTKCLRNLTTGGTLSFLLRMQFLEGQRRGAGLWRKFPAQHVSICSKRPSFTGDGKTDATAYAQIEWRNPYFAPTTLDWLTF